MTSRTAAIRYARALFDVALKEGADVQQVGRELSGFAAMVAGHEGLERVFANPVVPAPKKRAILEELLGLGGAMHGTLRKLLLLLADRDRLMLLPQVVSGYDSRLLDHAQVVRAEVTTAVELPADRLAAMKAGLSKATGRDVHLESRVDASLIGGAVTRIGSTVYDGSLTRQLAKMKDSLSQA